MHRAPRCLSLFALTIAAGCAPSTLPVRHVVIYRNGVAYFERGGHVAQDQVRFKMKATGVGDLLATMAVTDRARGDAGAASFPVRAVDLDARGDDRPDRGNGAETVVLSLDGKGHDLAVGYIAESPVWKPSYRLVVHARGTASLQIWGIVQNFSGEDWKGVALSLVAGAPIAYSSDLASPVTPSRPMVSDHGQEPIAVPRSEASYGYRDDPMAAYRAQRNQLGQVVAEETVAHTASDAEIRARQARLIARSAEGSRLGRLTGDVVVQAGTTRYDLPQTFSIADQSASMVMVLDRVVAGEIVLLFAPDAAVADSATRPFRAVRFENSTGGALEPGPVAMFEEGSFIGQAVTEPLGAGATGTVPFALERGVSVSREVRTDEASGPLTAGIAGELTIERERVTQTTYRVQNGTDRPAKVVVKHARAPGLRLRSPPAGTEENVLLGTALVPVNVAAQASAELVVDERAPATGSVDWLSPAADFTVKAFLADGRSDPSVVRKLSAAWAIRADLTKLDTERASLRMQSYNLSQDDAARRRPETASKLAAMGRRIAELDDKFAALEAKFHGSMREIRMAK